MRSTVKISALILLYFLACGKSCDDNEQHEIRFEKERIATRTDSLRRAFGADTLSASSLRAYMETARQKFFDYNDYLRILSDTSTAGPFRDKTRKMISSIFIPGAEPVKIMPPFDLESVDTKEAYRKISDSVYEGSLALSYKPGGQEVKPGIALTESSIKVFLVKNNKHFGKDKLRIWEVFLGKME